MTTLSKNASNGDQLTAAQNAVKLCSSANSVTGYNPTVDISRLPGWKIVWNGQQTVDANYAFIATDPTEEIYVLAIRGSLVDKKLIDWDDFANWILEDFDVAKQVSWEFAATANAKISNGANIGFTNLVSMKDLGNSNLLVTDYLINNAVTKGKQVIITGHSLGGNIANVFTSYFITTLTQQNLSSDNVSLYTFAAPAPGNGDFAKDLDAKLPTAWHYQNLNDAIPNFPVDSDIRKLVQWYSPAPAASAISFTNKKGKVTQLVDAINDLAGLLTLTDLLNLSAYKQQANNYTKFQNALTPNHVDNSLAGWFGQAIYQHQLFNYATYLGVVLHELTDQYV